MILSALRLRRVLTGREVYSGLPEELYTGLNALDADKRPRVRVDVAQTSFFEGREFRAFRDFSLPAGNTSVIRVTVPLNIIVFEQLLSSDDSKVLFGAYSDGTPGGTWTELPTVLSKNEMLDKPAYTREVTLHYGGTHTGGTLRDIARIVSVGQGNSQATVGGSVADERGIAPGTYYLRFQNYGSDTANVTYKIFWEERP